MATNKTALKDEVVAKFQIDIPDKIADLIDERRRDKGKELTTLPKIPSGQLWSTFSEEEKSKWKELMSKQGLNPDEVLKAHLPIGPNIPQTTKWRVHA